MKLFFDARFIRTDYHDGISRYSTELANALGSSESVTFIICDDGQRKFLPENKNFIKIHPPTSFKEPFTSIILNKHRPDVVFSPMQTLGSFGKKFRLILTLHDMIYYRHKTAPKQFNRAIRMGWRIFHASYWPQRIILNRADTVATVSHTSKQQILNARLTKRPVIVIPNAPRTLTSGNDKQATSPKNLIYMGSFMPYKNVEALISSMEFLPGYTLHLLSRISDTRKSELESIVTYKARVRFHSGVSDEKYTELLTSEALLVSASLDEGYGLPIAEALAVGTPAAVSNLDIFREVAGEGALYFDPHNPNDIANKIKKASEKETYKMLKSSGKKHISQFSWQTSAEKLLAAASRLVK